MSKVQNFFRELFASGSAASNPVEQLAFDACLNGDHHNPYPLGSVEGKDWQKGQRKGYDEQARYY